MDIRLIHPNKTVTSISSGEYTVCAVADSKAYCWGSNEFGQLGNNSTDEISRVPVPVDTSGVLKNKIVTDIEVSIDHACAIAEGKAYCWGANESGQLGNNSTENSPVPVAVDASGAEPPTDGASGNKGTWAPAMA